MQFIAHVNVFCGLYECKVTRNNGIFLKEPCFVVKKWSEFLVVLKVCITFAPANTGIAQLVEHRSPKPSVGSSSLSSRAGIIRYESMIYVGFFYLGKTEVG